MRHSRVAFQLFDLVHDEAGRPPSVAPSFDIRVCAVDALEDAAAFRLNRNRRAVSLVALEIDPLVERRSRKRIEIGVVAGRGEVNTVAMSANEARERAGVTTRGDCVN